MLENKRASQLSTDLVEEVTEVTYYEITMPKTEAAAQPSKDDPQEKNESGQYSHAPTSAESTPDEPRAIACEPRPKTPPRTKKKYRKSNTVDVTRFGVKVIQTDNDSLEEEDEVQDEENTSRENANVSERPKLNDSLEIELIEKTSTASKTIITNTNKKDIEFLYEICTKVEHNESVSNFERTFSKRPLWDKTSRQEVDLMFHRSPLQKENK